MRRLFKFEELHQSKKINALEAKFRQRILRFLNPHKQKFCFPISCPRVILMTVVLFSIVKNIARLTKSGFSQARGKLGLFLLSRGIFRFALAHKSSIYFYKRFLTDFSPFQAQFIGLGGSLIPDLYQIGRKTRPSGPTDVQQAVVLIDYNILLSTEMQMITFHYLPTFNLKHFTIY